MACNSAQIEEVQLRECCEMLQTDKTSLEWDKQLLDADRFILDDSYLQPSLPWL